MNRIYLILSEFHNTDNKSIRRDGPLMLKSLAINTALLALVCSALLLVSLFTLEIAFSHFSAEARLPVNGEVGKDRFTWGHLVVNNTLGFREKEVIIPKPKGLIRIMVLGDSLTWGAGLSTEERYTALLEKHLRDEFQSTNIEVLNFGYSGGPTTRERDILLTLGEKLQPDLIVIGFCLNDPQQKGEEWSVEREQLRQKLSWFFQVTDKLRSYQLLRVSERLDRVVDPLSEKFNLVPSWEERMAQAYNQSGEQWKTFVQALTDIKKYSDASVRSTPVFAVLNQIVFDSKPSDYGSSDPEIVHRREWYRQAEKEAQSLGFITCNYETEIMSELGGVGLAVNEVDGHPSKALNQVYAKKLFAIIKSSEIFNSLKQETLPLS